MARVRYMIEYIADPKKAELGEIEYVPCGVWAVSDTQFEIGILEKKFPERAEEIHWFLNYLAENDIRPWVSEGFLEYWRDQRSPYKGMFSEMEQIEVSGINAFLDLKLAEM